MNYLSKADKTDNTKEPITIEINDPTKSLLNNLTRLASNLSKMPLAIIGLFTKEGWLLQSIFGTVPAEEKNHLALCSKVIQEKRALIIEDASIDKTYLPNSPSKSATYFKAFLGLPIVNSKGEIIGVLALFDSAPHKIEQDLLKSLELLAEQASELLEVSNRLIEVNDLNSSLKEEIKEQRRQEDEQRERDEHFRSLIEDVKGYAVYMIDRAGYIISWNIGAERLTGYRADEVLGKHFSIFHTNEDLNSDYPKRELAIASTEGRFEDESWRIRKNGTRFWASIIVTALRDETGKLYGFSRLIHDITEQKIIEAKLRMSESQYRMLMEQASDGIFILDRSARFFISVNPKACEMLGFTQEELKRRPVPDIFPNNPESNIPLLFDQLQEGGSIIAEQKLQHKNGSTLITELSASRLEDGRIQATVRDITKRKEAEEALAASEKRYRHLIEKSKTFICTHDLDGRILTINQATTDALGYTQEEMIGRSMQEFLHPSVKHLFHNYLKNAKQQPMVRGLMRMLSKDGKELFWSYQNSHYEENGKVLYILGHAQDVTQKIYAEEALQRSQSLYSSLVEGLPFNLYIKNRDGKFTFVNKRFYETVGKSSVEVIDRTDMKVFPADLAKEFAETDRLVIERGEVYEGVISYVTSDGEKQYFQLIKTPVRGFRGEITGTQGIFWDITERQRVEEARAHFVAILEETTDLVCIIDKHGYTTYINRAGRNMLGIVDTFKEVHLPDHHPEWAKSLIYKEALPKAIATGAWAGETAFINPDGSELPVSQIILAHKNKEGEVQYFSTVARDITAQKQLETELANSRDAALASAKLKSQFVANMSHEIRTPMNGILGMASLLLTTELDDAQREFTEAIDKSAQSLLDVINDILDFSKIEAGKLNIETEEFNLYTTIENSFDLLIRQAQSKGLDFHCLIGGSVPTVICGDPGRLRQILTNLVGNAIKFTDKGEITVRVTKERETSTYTTIRFTISDTGIGLPEGAEYRIFNAFTQLDGSLTRQYGGTGLGLAICKQLVEMMGGQIGVQSKLGEGSTFWFTLRLENPTSQVAASSLKMNALDGMNILLISSNESTRNFIDEQTSEWGVNISYALSSKETLLKLEEAKVNGKPTSVVILDMPAPDAAVIARSIKANPHLSNIALILLVPMYQPVNTKQIEEAGMHTYLSKPMKPSRLYNTLVKLLDHNQTLKTELETCSTIRTESSSLLVESTQDNRATNILLVEDNEINRLVILGLLKKMGYSADIVTNGLEAIRAVEIRDYDLIFMDCQMPVMDGFKATAEIRRVSKRHIPIIAMTAHTMAGDRERCLGAGMDDYIAKPLNEKELQKLMANWTSQRYNPKNLSLEENHSDKILDLEIIDYLSKLKTPEETDLLEEVINRFTDDTPQQMKAIRAALAAKEFDLIASISHQLKSCIGSLGIKQAMVSAALLEAESLNRNLNEVDRLIEQLEVELSKSYIALKELKK
jgi:two-component system, sensor histidine kinase and response regulator